MAKFYKESAGERIFGIVNILLLMFIGAATLFPFLNIVARSLNESIDTIKGGITIYPRMFTLNNFKHIFNDNDVPRAYLITILRTLTGTTIAVISTIMAAYAVSRKTLPGRKWIMLYILVPMFFSGGFIPSVINIRELGLANNFWVYVLPMSFGIYHMIITMSYLKTIPDALEESAKIDGASYTKVFISIILPLSAPILATITLMFAVMHWNSWMDAFLYVTDKKLHHMQMLLARMIMLNEAANTETMLQSGGGDYERVLPITPESIKAAAVVVTILPIVCFYPFLQKYFIKGMMIGSVKG